MQIDTAGTYLLKYTAEDECGNVTEVTREVVAEVITYRTVLYTDGTLIINEKSTDIDANVAEHGAATNVYVPFDPNGSTDTEKYIGIVPWDNQRTSIKSVEIGTPISPTSTSIWFRFCSNLQNADLSNLDTSNVTSMERMFDGCSALTSLDLSSFNTSNVTKMGGMFLQCSALTSLDLSSFNTSNVTDMSNMFDECSALTSLDLSSFNTSNVTDMSNMFDGCSALTSLDLSSFNTSNVTDMTQMFYNDWRLRALNVSNFDTSNVTSMEGMFYGCLALTSLDLSSFNTSNVTDMRQMFAICRNLVTIYSSILFVTTQVTASTYMFKDNIKLVGGAGTGWSSSYTDKTYARIDGGTSDPGYFTARSA